ncbi:MAG: 2-dehydropantoate 2-reductase [Pseudomonadota bacterium]
MRLLIVGSGGVGGYFGAKLAKAGVDVTLLARGAHLAAIKRNGLTIRSAVEGDWTVQVNAVDDVSGLPSPDIILFCVKSFDTESAAELVAPIVGPDTGVISLQNGIDNEDKISRVVGAGHAMGGVAYVFSSIAEPGVIAHQQFGKIVFGELSATTSERSEAFRAACEKASIPVQLSADVQKALWQKFIYQAAQGGTTAVTRLPIKYLREVPETRALWLMQIEELLAISVKAGIRFDTDFIEKATAFVEGLDPTNTSSLYQDLVSGRRIELDAFHGHAIERGAKLGVPTPTLTAVDAALRPHLNGAPTA